MNQTLSQAIQACFSQIHDQLKQSNNQPLIAVAESCSGGQLATQLSLRPGSSGYFWGGLVTYMNEAKQRLLGVPPEIIATHGAVSHQTVAAMLSGLSTLLHNGIGAAISGIAGPDGGSPEKPVGTVVIGTAQLTNGQTTNNQTQTYHFLGDRPSIQSQAVLQAGRLIFNLLNLSKP